MVRTGNTVRRPAGPHTPAVHAFLRHLHDVGFGRVPRPLGIDDDGREILTYLPGAVVHPGHDHLLDPPRALTEIGKLIRAFHDASAEFTPPAEARWQVVIPDVGAELIVHHDLAAWNLVRSRHGWYLIDWDTAAPGTRLWDLAYAAHSLIPLSADPGWARPDPEVRLRCLVDAYGLDENARRRLVDLLPDRTRAMYRLLQEGADTGTEPWATLWAAGHGVVWKRNTDHLERHRGTWLSALLR
ncbi:phosphotransferase [Pseudonocardia sp. EC080619-01]|uniref:phosphotransferase n=1 Tax=Pseudonocardia sp. EC080619-01 TaxID=1096856 RepID=UPI003514E453